MSKRDRAPADKKYFTIEEANRTLPLVRRIVTDITTLAHAMKERHERLEDLTGPAREEAEDALQSDQDRMHELCDELHKLGIELKDYFTGLVDFPCWKDGREIYLCWRLDEPTIAHWHEVWAGFSGRRPLQVEV
jgi:hypothetical protein